MPVGYTTSTWMKHLDAKANPQLVKLLLKHDPKMISQIYNYDFEDVKGIIDESISYLRKTNFLSVSTHKELAKILNYAYSRKRVFRKQFLNSIVNLHQDIRYWNRSIEGEFDINDYIDNLYDMFLYDPMYMLVLKDEFIKKILDLKGKTFQDYCNEIGSIDKHFNKMQQKISKHNSWRADTNYEKLMDIVMGYYYYRTHDNSIVFASIDEKIDSMSKVFGEDNPFASTLLYLKISN